MWRGAAAVPPRTGGIDRERCKAPRSSLPAVAAAVAAAVGAVQAATGAVAAVVGADALALGGGRAEAAGAGAEAEEVVTAPQAASQPARTLSLSFIFSLPISKLQRNPSGVSIKHEADEGGPVASPLAVTSEPQLHPLPCRALAAATDGQGRLRNPSRRRRRRSQRACRRRPHRLRARCDLSVAGAQMSRKMAGMLSPEVLRPPRLPPTHALPRPAAPSSKPGTPSVATSGSSPPATPFGTATVDSATALPRGTVMLALPVATAHARFPLPACIMTTTHLPTVASSAYSRNRLDVSHAHSAFEYHRCGEHYLQRFRCRGANEDTQFLSSEDSLTTGSSADLSNSSDDSYLFKCKSSRNSFDLSMASQDSRSYLITQSPRAKCQFPKFDATSRLWKENSCPQPIDDPTKTHVEVIGPPRPYFTRGGLNCNVTHLYPISDRSRTQTEDIVPISANSTNLDVNPDSIYSRTTSGDQSNCISSYNKREDVYATTSILPWERPNNWEQDKSISKNIHHKKEIPPSNNLNPFFTLDTTDNVQSKHRIYADEEEGSTKLEGSNPDALEIVKETGSGCRSRSTRVDAKEHTQKRGDPNAEKRLRPDGSGDRRQAYIDLPSTSFCPEPSTSFFPEPSTSFFPEPSTSFFPEPSTSLCPEPDAQTLSSTSLCSSRSLIQASLDPFLDQASSYFSELPRLFLHPCRSSYKLHHLDSPLETPPRSPLLPVSASASWEELFFPRLDPVHLDDSSSCFSLKDIDEKEAYRSACACACSRPQSPLAEENKQVVTLYSCMQKLEVFNAISNTFSCLE